MPAVSEEEDTATGTGSSSRPPPGALSIQPGARFGDLELDRKLGQGAQGVVYLGRQVSVNRQVAVKILPKDIAFTQEQIDRFLREGRSAGRLNHPNIVSVFGLEESGGHHLIVQEFVQGGSLDEVLKERTKEGHHTTTGDCTWAAGMCAKLADALHHAHEHGVVHRDMKPGNVLLTESGVPKITDFGLAHVDDNMGLSRTGAVMGTPHYMSPEQVQAHPSEIDARTDVYGLGALLYHMLAGQVLFSGESVQSIFLDILTREPRPLRKLEPGVSNDLEAVCLKALEKDPDDRYQTAREFADDLERYLRGEPTLARPVSFVGRSVRHMRRLATSTLAVVALLVPTAWLLIDMMVLEGPALEVGDAAAPMHWVRLGLVVLATLLLAWPLSLMGVRLAKGNPRAAVPAWILALALGGLAGWHVHDQRLTTLHHAAREALQDQLRLEQVGDGRVVSDLVDYAETWGPRFDAQDHWLIARGYLKRQRPVQAEQWALRLAESKQDSAESPAFHALLAAIYDMLGRGTEAQQEQQAVTRTASAAKDWLEWKQIGDIWRELARYPDALEAYERAGRMPSVDRDRLNLDMALVLADLCEFEESEENLDDFMRWNEEDPTAQHLAMTIDMKEQRWDEAEVHLSAYESHPLIAAKDKLATRMAFVDARDDDRMRTAAERAHAEAETAAAEAAAEAAAAAVEPGAEAPEVAEPEPFVASLALQEQLQALSSEALALVRDAERQHRSDPDVLNWCASQWLQEARIKHAYADYYAMVEDGDAERVRRDVAKQNVGKAQELFTRVRQLLPEAAYPLINLMVVEQTWADLEPEHAESRLQSAVRHAERAVELDPSYFQTHYNLGTARWRQARQESGVDIEAMPLEAVQPIAEAFEQAVEFNGTDVQALNDAASTLVRVYEITADPAVLERGLSHAARALRLMKYRGESGCGMSGSDFYRLSSIQDTLSRLHQLAGDLPAALASARIAEQAMRQAGDRYAPNIPKRAERVEKLQALVEGGG